jgi:hypothetical protein
VLSAEEGIDDRRRAHGKDEVGERMANLYGLLFSARAIASMCVHSVDRWASSG